MGYNSARYIHTLYQAMNLAFADRDFYYGDPYFPPDEPTKGLLSKDYAQAAREGDRLDEERSERQPGRSVSVSGRDRIRFRISLERWTNGRAEGARPAGHRPGRARLSALARSRPHPLRRISLLQSFYAGTTSVEAADAEGWVVSVTPSGGWLPAVHRRAAPASA